MQSARSAAAEYADVSIPGRVQTANIWRLVIAQALAGANAVAIYATGAIIGNQLAPDPVLATLPISIFVVGMAACILPAGAIARYHGRRAAFLAGTGAGVMTGVLAAAAVFVGSFWLFCVATFLGGAYAAVVLSFRFAAADGVAPSRRARALSLVMVGGVVAGVVGPQLVNWTMDLWPPHTFVPTFLAQAAVAAVAAVVLFGVRLPAQAAQDRKSPAGRPLAIIARQPRFIAAVTCGAVTYLVMNFIMTAAPLAMHLHGHAQTASNSALQWHVIAMYAPSFFTGHLITRFGALRIAAVGILLTALSAVVGLGGIAVVHFWWLLVLLGVGWNFGFLGASALVLECHAPEEKTQVQSLNDFIVFGLMAIGSFSSGGLLSAYGWGVVLSAALIPLVIATVALVAVGRRGSSSGRAEAAGRYGKRCRRGGTAFSGYLNSRLAK